MAWEVLESCSVFAFVLKLSLSILWDTGSCFFSLWQVTQGPYLSSFEWPSLLSHISCVKVRSLMHGPVSVWFWFPVAAGHGEHLATFRQPALPFLNALPDPQLLHTFQALLTSSHS